MHRRTLPVEYATKEAAMKALFALADALGQ
jgi:hypothetical protein